MSCDCLERLLLVLGRKQAEWDAAQLGRPSGLEAMIWAVSEAIKEPHDATDPEFPS